MTKPIAVAELVPEAREALVKQVAALVVASTSEYDISQAVGISERQVRKILSSDECKAMIKDIGDAAIRVAVQTIRQRTSHLAHLATQVLEKALHKGDLEAVKLVFRTAGIFEAAEQKAQGDTNLTVVLPGKAEPKEVKSATINGEFRVLGEEAKNE